MSTSTRMSTGAGAGAGEGAGVAAAPTGVEPLPGRRNRGAAVLALARFEARELLLQAPVFVFFLLYFGATCWKLFFKHEGMNDYPALQDVDRATQNGALLVSVFVLTGVNRATLLSRRRDTDRHFETLVMDPWRRAIAHALSAVPLAAAVALTVTLDFTWAALKPGAVGHGSVLELVVSPLTVLLAGVLGVLLARLIPSVLGGPLFVIAGFVATTVVPGLVTDAHWLRWLSPVVDETGPDAFPSDLMGRPAAWHALYLAGLVALVLGAAVLRAGGRTRLVKAATAVALAATVAGIAGQSPGDSAALTAARAKAYLHPEKVQSCREIGTTTYCAYPEWAGRSEDWAAVVKRVQSLAGGAAGGERLTVRQRVDARQGLEGGASMDPLTGRGQVTVGTRWGGNRVPEFAVGLAGVLVGGDERSGGTVCDGRVVTIMWLALGADPDPMAALRNVRLEDNVTGSSLVLAPTAPLIMSTEQTRIVRELLHMPRYGVTARVKAHWTELTSPRTSMARVAELLGVPAAPKGSGDGEWCEK
ncbi:ABC transporter permease [Streptomyces sp. NPDC005485]|uniref:ABC transporter permease n=1 Tax=Streptomyces sp. NPDC005485 TaxID=3155591 RepID=UPI0033B74F75